MISENALSKVSRPAALGRARIIARRNGWIWQRSCDYRHGETTLEANVDSSSTDDAYYLASITFDESADTVVSYMCDCPASRTFPGPCKHALALALEYNSYPDRYQGFDPMVHVVTSPVLSLYLDRMMPEVAARVVPAVQETRGTIGLDPTIVVTTTACSLRLRVVGSRGSYVVKSIQGLVGNVESGAFHEYGKKLAFTHERNMFDARSRALLDLLDKAVQNRRAYETNRYGWSGAGGTSMGREMVLSAPEFAELLDLWSGSVLHFESEPYYGITGVMGDLEVCDGDPDVGLGIEPASEGGFVITLKGEASFFQVGQDLYAVQNAKLFRCREELRSQSGFFASVYRSDREPMLLSADDARRFAALALPGLEEAMPVSVPAELEVLKPQAPRFVFRLDRTSRDVTCRVEVTYGAPSSDPLVGRPSASGGPVTFDVLARGVGDAVDPVRDLREEADVRAMVGMFFSIGKNGVAKISDRDDDAVARLVYDGVPRMQKAGTVESTDAFDRLLKETTPRVRVGLAVKSNLLNLTVSADDLPLSELYALLNSYRLKRRFHRLKDGSFVDLARVDLREAALVADELGLTNRELSRGKARIPSYKAFLLDSIMSDDEKDESFAAYMDNFRAVDPSTYVAPESLAGVLRPYQLKGFQWLSALCAMDFGGILADEMGLGKSLQMISFLLANRGKGQTLIVCPASLVYNWQEEFHKFAPDMEVEVVAGNAQERRAIRGEDGYEVLITSYDLLRRDVEDYAQMHLWCEVLDEAQYIKNHSTLAARAVKALRAKHRFALTGTPIENRLSELWSIFDFLMPGLLGSYDRFRDRYENAIMDGDEAVAARLRQAISPFVMRRLKADVLVDLPEKLEQVVYAPLHGRQRELYAAREQALRLSLTQKTDSAFATDKLQVLAELMRLRQICCDPRLLYDDYDGGSQKLDTIMELVSSAVDAQEKMLIFSQFTSFLDLIGDKLESQGIKFYTITGATEKRRRLELVNAFNADDTPVFLISLKAGGTGLNLTGASVVIHADPWWNVAAQNQATDRAHRIGQTHEVTVYKVIARDTIEDRILALQEAKRDLAEQVVGAGEGTSLASLRKEDLIDLLGD